MEKKFLNQGGFGFHRHPHSADYPDYLLLCHLQDLAGNTAHEEFLGLG